MPNHNWTSIKGVTVNKMPKLSSTLGADLANLSALQDGMGTAGPVSPL